MTNIIGYQFWKHRGLSNHIFNLVHYILTAYNCGKQLVVMDEMYTDLFTSETRPLNEIIDLNSLNQYLWKRYQLIMIDRRDYEKRVVLEHATYGAENMWVEILGQDLTNLRENGISSKEDLYVRWGDPCPGMQKRLVLHLQINGLKILRNYLEYGHHFIDNIPPLSISSSSLFYEQRIGWINTIDQTSFDTLLKTFVFQPEFTDEAHSFVKNSKLETGCSVLNVLHLRTEPDALEHWSGRNDMSIDEFQARLLKTYHRLIVQYFSKTDLILVLTYDVENNVTLDFLRHEGYRVCWQEKKKKQGREINALYDLLAGEQCNGCFIGNFNTKLLRGSTFSYLLLTRMDPSVKKVLVDLDEIDQPEIILSA